MNIQTEDIESGDVRGGLESCSRLQDCSTAEEGEPSFAAAVEMLGRWCQDSAPDLQSAELLRCEACSVVRTNRDKFLKHLESRRHLITVQISDLKR